jgi:aminoglycoside 6'-N-acetyltransferase
MPTYQFRAVTRADLPLLREWLGCGHVRKWWGDPAHGLARIAEHIDSCRIFVTLPEQ